ncbi:MAG: glycosyltransferase [Mariprofundaceae bacterium]|nr:glycosyltransferase [Mariprofundaceae bacterium]
MRYACAFLVGTGLPIRADSVEKESLGGSETAVVCLSRALARRGHSVKVFCPVDEASFDRYGVEYLPVSTFDDVSPVYDFDLLVIVRNPVFASKKTRAKMIWLWNHDVLPSGFGSWEEHLWQTDAYLFLSQFHLYVYEREAPAHSRDAFLKHVIITRNGIDRELIGDPADPRAPRDPYYFLYTSRPERGVKILLTRIWPQIKKRIPQARLGLAWYTFSKDLPLARHVSYEIEAAEELARTSSDLDVTFLGNLPKARLYEEMRRAQAWLYPTQFAEISCISVMEAQHCGAIPITTKDFALPETVGQAGILIEGDAASQRYQDDFVKAVVDLVEARGRSFDLRHQCVEMTAQRKRYWDDIAAEWECVLTQLFEKRYAEKRDRILENLIYHSDIVAVRDWAKLHGLDEWEKRAQQLIDVSVRKTDQFHLVESSTACHDNWDHRWRFVKLADHIERFGGHVSGSWLDVGCHNGDFLTYVNTRWPPMHGVGVDVGDRVIKEAMQFSASHAKTPSHLRFETLSWRDLCVGTEHIHRYDVVVAGEILEHIEHVTEFLSAIELCAKPGGLVAVTMPIGPMESIAWRHEEGAEHLPQHIHHFTIRDIQQIFGEKDEVFSDAGFWTITSRGEIVGHWFICWRANPKKTGFGSIDLEHKVKTTLPYQRVSCCMIVKDEADNISRCLKSVVPYVDEIIIHDTGSTDDTLAIAQKVIPHVYQPPTLIITQGEWPHDFAAARNASIRHATGDWILWLDADEVLVNGRGMHKYLMHDSLYEGFVLRQRHLTLDAEHHEDVPVRIFRRRPSYRFVGVIHEHVESGPEGTYDQPVVPALVLPDTMLAHYGYLTEADRRWKIKTRNMELLIKDLKQHPERKLAWVLLIRDHLNLVKWSVDQGKVLTDDDILHLQEIVRLYHEHQMWRDDFPYFTHAWKVYQSALMFLAKAGMIPHGGTHIPLVLDASMAIGLGQVTESHKSERLWFRDIEDLNRYLNRQVKRAEEHLRVAYTRVPEAYAFPDTVREAWWDRVKELVLYADA